MRHFSNLLYKLLCSASLVSLIFFIGVAIKPADAQEINPVIRQLTDFTDNDVFLGRRSVTSDGSMILAISDININGGNPDENFEVYVFNVPLLDLDDILQITDTSDCAMGDSSISGDGNIAAFISTCDITGQNQNNLQQGFYYNRTSEQFVQYTNNTNGNVSIIVISKDGSTIAIRSTMDINGGNPDSKDEIFTFDINSSTLTQITFSDQDSTSPDINSDGSVLAITSRADFTGQNPTNQFQLFTYDGIFRQITNTTSGLSGNGSLSDDGSKIAFTSNSDVLGPGPFINQIYLYDDDTLTITQITNVTEAIVGSAAPTISGDGERILFKSDGNVFGTPTDGQEQIYLYESGKITQLTNFVPGEILNFVIDPEISCDGNSFIFTAILPAEFPNNSQLFKGLFERQPINIPSLSEWGLIAMAGILGIAGLLVVRRRKASV